MSQNKTILNHLKKHGSITCLDAIQQYFILRLSARIWDLREEGHQIKTVIIQSGKKSFAKYILEL